MGRPGSLGQHGIGRGQSDPVPLETPSCCPDRPASRRTSAGAVGRVPPVVPRTVEQRAGLLVAQRFVCAVADSA